MPNKNLGFTPAQYKMRKARFLEEMEAVVPWAQLLALIAPHDHTEDTRPQGGRSAYPLEVMLRGYDCVEICRFLIAVSKTARKNRTVWQKGEGEG